MPQSVRRIALVSTVLCLVILPREAAGQSAAAGTACAEDFEAAHGFVTRDYAGYPDRLRGDGPRLTALTDSVRVEVRTAANDSSCTAILQRWIAPLREHDHHLQLWQPRPPAATGASTAAPASGADPQRPAIRFADDSTAVITLPTFGQRYKVIIDSLVATHRDRLARTPYLVVDIRRNGGGWTRAYTSVMALLYTDPIQREAFLLWASEGNIAVVRDMLNAPDVNPEMKAQAQAMLPVLEAKKGEFVGTGEVNALRFDTVHAMPRAVAVLTGRGCASSCEQFVLDAEYSRKVTTLGQDNTAGFLDYGNIRTVTLPSKIRRFAIPTARSGRLPRRPLDKIGIAPQVRIPKDDPDPIAFAVRHLQAAAPRP